jgi:hypothetical protein
MRIRATGAIAAALLLANSAAGASEWVEVGRSKDGTAFQIDVSSIRIEGPVRRAWGKSIPPSHTVKGYPGNEKKFVSYFLSRAAFNCADETMKSEAMMVYFEDGGVDTVPVDLLPQFAKWTPVPPDTPLSLEMQSVCSSKPK